MAQDANAVVVVFTMAGCSACSEYKPRFMRIAESYRQYVPVLMFDANDSRPDVADLANRLGVTNVPVTFVLRRPTGMMKIEGGIPDSQIAWLLGVAAREAAGPTLQRR